MSTWTGRGIPSPLCPQHPAPQNPLYFNLNRRRLPSAVPFPPPPRLTLPYLPYLPYPQEICQADKTRQPAGQDGASPCGPPVLGWDPILQSRFSFFRETLPRDPKANIFPVPFAYLPAILVSLCGELLARRLHRLLAVTPPSRPRLSICHWAGLAWIHSSMREDRLGDM